ncbi:MAG TPA: 3'-5' exonuclease [Thermodesulfobacteriota bacterium]|nr:3'-5' exonuclease [Thermodesulfobacteriota bacterium]
MQSLWPRLKALYYRYRLRQRDFPPQIQENLKIHDILDVRKPINETEFVVFDTETTGLDAKGGDGIVSISAVRIKNGRIDLSDLFHALINPSCSIPSSSVIIHEIRPQMVAGKPTLEEMLPHFVEYIRFAVLVAHNAKVDMVFLNRGMVRLYGFPIQNMVLDTIHVDQMLEMKKNRFSRRDKILMDTSLSALAERYSVPVEGRHSSLGDALTTAQIFQRMIREAQTFGIISLKDLVRSIFYTGTHHSPFLF